MDRIKHFRWRRRQGYWKILKTDKFSRSLHPDVSEYINSLVTHDFFLTSSEKRQERKRNQEHLPIVVKSCLARTRTCTYGDLEARRGRAPASGTSVVDEQGRGCRRGAWG